MKNTVATFKKAKGAQKLSMLTAYDYTTARIIDKCGINSILVGDSLGMVMLGYESTVPVTMEDMIHHCAAVARGVENALLICDMPFMSSQCGVEDTVRNAGRLIKEGGAQAVKMEGGAEFVPEVKALTRASIPVMAHIGLTPQSVNALGGYTVQGKEAGMAQKLLDDARSLEDAGAFSILLECVPAALGARLAKEVSVPVIGIGAGPGCDGQVLVWQDMLGINQGHTPKFVRRFAEIGMAMEKAIREYGETVACGDFPASEHCYGMNEENLKKLY